MVADQEQDNHSPFHGIYFSTDYAEAEKYNKQ